MGGRSCFITSGAFGDTLLCIVVELGGGGSAISGATQSTQFKCCEDPKLWKTN